MQVQSYLFFDGRCEEALNFTRPLGAEVTMLMRFKDAPPQPQQSSQDGCGPAQVDPENHACQCDDWRDADHGLRWNEQRQARIQGLCLSVEAPNEVEAERMFNAIGQGGKVQMPLGTTFFARCFGMVTDRFGVSWMVIVPLVDIG